MKNKKKSNGTEATKSLKTPHVYVVEKKNWDYECRDSKRGYFNLRWNVASENEIKKTGVSHTRNDYYDENSGVTFRVLSYSQKEAVNKVRRYVREKNYPVFKGLGGGTDYVSLRIN